MESDRSQTLAPSPRVHCWPQLSLCQLAWASLLIVTVCGNCISLNMAWESASGFLLWLHRMVRISLSYNTQMCFLIVSRICGDMIFKEIPIYKSCTLQAVLFCFSVQVSKQFPSPYLGEIWIPCTSVNSCLMEIYLCVHHLRRLFSEHHLHVRCLCSLELRIFPHSCLKSKDPHTHFNS